VLYIVWINGGDILHYDVVNGEVLICKEVVTDNQVATVREYYCLEKRLKLVADKAVINAGGIDKVIIIARVMDWQGNNIGGVFGLEFVINGCAYDVYTNGDGVAEIEFASYEAGKYEVVCRANKMQDDRVIIEVV